MVKDYIALLPSNNSSLTAESEVEHHFFTDAFGTIDARWCDDDERPHICDFKTGSTPVEVKGNEQLLTYAYFHSTTWCYQNVRPILHIAQPKVSPRLQTWEPTDEEWEAAKKQIDWALDSVYNGPVVLKTGKHCARCRAKDFCPQKKAEREAVVEGW